MNPIVKAKWIDALSTYKQTWNKLYDGECFCVLGVLVDLYLKEKGEEWKCGCGGYYFNDEFIAVDKPVFPNPDYVLNEKIQKWAGLDSSDPDLVIAGEAFSMSYLNDVTQVSFDEFKELINNQL